MRWTICLLALSAATTALAAAASESFTHAPLSYFALDKLTPKGPRKNADVGDPSDATRGLYGSEDGAVKVGAWSCTAGGWDSPTPRPTTECFYVLAGAGSVDDVDGTRHAFGPGDTVVLPRGWHGRWDIEADIHKVWCVHAHADVDPGADGGAAGGGACVGEGGPPRAVVAPLPAPTESDRPLTLDRIYDVGATRVECWTCAPGSFVVNDQQTTVSHMWSHGVTRSHTESHRVTPSYTELHRVRFSTPPPHATTPPPHHPTPLKIKGVPPRGRGQFGHYELGRQRAPVCGGRHRRHTPRLVRALGRGRNSARHSGWHIPELRRRARAIASTTCNISARGRRFGFSFLLFALSL